MARKMFLFASASCLWLINSVQAVTHIVLAHVQILLEDFDTVFQSKYRNDWSLSNVLDFILQAMLHAKCNLPSM